MQRSGYIEIETMWHLKAKPVSVVVGALAMIQKGCEKHPNNISGSLCQ